MGNDGALTANAATKGAHFVELCCHRQIPIIFLQNLPPEGSITDIGDGESMGDVIRARSKMMTAVACAKVPKITVIVGDSFGPSNFAMVRKPSVNLQLTFLKSGTKMLKNINFFLFSNRSSPKKYTNKCL